jgi:hypothetical protein
MDHGIHDHEQTPGNCMERAPMKKLRMLRPFRNYRTGQVVEIPGGIAAELIAKKFAVEDRQQELIETAALEPEAETADATPKRRGRRAIPKPDQSDAARR